MKLFFIIFSLATAAFSLSSCSDNSKQANPDAETEKNQTVDKNPQVDRDPTPETSTGGDQQGSVPAQPNAQ